MVSAYKSCAAFIKEMKKGHGALLLERLLRRQQGARQELDKEGRGVQISQVVPFPWDGSIPVVREYQRPHQAEGKEPNFSSLQEDSSRRR